MSILRGIGGAAVVAAVVVVVAATGVAAKAVESSVTVPAGGEASMPFTAYCLEFGEPFPATVSVTADMAPAEVVSVLRAAAVDGTGEREPLTTQLAVWRAAEGRWTHGEDETDLSKAQALYTAATDRSADDVGGEGTSLAQALAAGQVTAEVTGWSRRDADLASPTDAPYYGSGALRITNETGADLVIRAPLGLVLKATNAAEQDMALFAVSQQAEATATPVRTAAPTATTGEPAGLPRTGDGGGTWVLWPMAALAGLLVLGAGRRLAVQRSRGR